MKKQFSDVSEVTRKVLKECTVDGCTVYGPSTRLTKKAWADMKANLELLGGKWNSPKQCFIFKSDPTSGVNEAIETGKVYHRVNTFQEFFTPPDLADVIAKLVLKHYVVKPTGGDFTVLEPSAGTGALVSAMIENYTFEAPPLFITAIEAQQENFDRLPKHPSARMPVCTDFLSVECYVNDLTGYHAVIMNPPFADRAYVKHVNHAMGFRRKDGILVAVVPDTAKLSDFDLPNVHMAFLTPVKAKFEGTGTRVKLLTIGIYRGVVEKAIKPIKRSSEAIDLRELKSPEFYLKQVKSAIKEVNKTMNDLERELGKCL